MKRAASLDMISAFGFTDFRLLDAIVNVRWATSASGRESRGPGRRRFERDLPRAQSTVGRSVGERSAGGKRKMPITLTTLGTTASGTSEGEPGKRRGNGGATLVLPFLSTRLFDVPPGASRFRTIRALNLARAIRAGVFVARAQSRRAPGAAYRPPMVFFCRFGEYGGNRDITDDPNTRDPAPEVPRRRRATDESSRRDSIRASLRFRPRTRSSGRLRRRSRRRRRGFFSRRRDRGNIGRQKERGANFFPDRDPDPSPPPPLAPSEPSLTVQNGYRRQGAPFHRHLRSRRLR